MAQTKQFAWKQEGSDKSRQQGVEVATQASVPRLEHPNMATEVFVTTLVSSVEATIMSSKDNPLMAACAPCMSFQPWDANNQGATSVSGMATRDEHLWVRVIASERKGNTGMIMESLLWGRSGTIRLQAFW